MTQFQTLLDAEITLSVLTSLWQDLGISPEQQLKNGIPSLETAKVQLRTAVKNDVTASLINASDTANAAVVCKEPCIFVGKAWVEQSFLLLDDSLELLWHTQDGQAHNSGDTLFEINGNTRAILTGERTALNFAQTLSATATEVARYAKLLARFSTQILDTRKTIPGLRYGQKYAVTCGGGANHRIGLYDRFLIKENHIMGCGNISAAIAAAKQHNDNLLIEVEVENLDELKQAIAAEADIIMLDNFCIEDVEKAVAINQGQCKLEVSGNVETDRLHEIAKTGVDFISSGAITKNIKAIDLSLRLINHSE